MRRVRTAVAAGMLLLLLTACTGLPTSGPVQPGNRVNEAVDAPNIDVVPDGPQPGAAPEQIVSGFLGAGSGPSDGWAVARQFLTPEFAPQWQPEDGVTIDRLSERSQPVSPTPLPTPLGDDVATVDLVQRVTAEALVNPEGEYIHVEGNQVALEFQLTRHEGEWRISHAPDGVVLYEELFPRVFEQASVMYFDPGWEYLVPDVRWFPAPSIATRIAQELVDGPPSDWLASAVSSAFPENVTLARSAVPVVDRTAQVELSEEALTLDTVILDRMQTQLERSLLSVGIPGVEMTVETSPIGAEALAVRETTVAPRPMVGLADGEFGLLSVDALEPLPGLSEAIGATSAVAVSVDPDRTSAAVLTAEGAVVRASADGELQELDTSRPGLVAPSIDSAGAVWSVPQNDPDAFLAFPSDADGPVSITAPWGAASELTAFQVSRDGTRMAALVAVDRRTEVWVAGIVREADGVPTALGEPLVLSSTSASTGLDIAWLDDVNLGALLRTAEGTTTLLKQPVGGDGTVTEVPSSVVDISGGNSSVRLRTAGGLLLIERGANWEESADEVAVLGVQQGSPQ